MISTIVTLRLLLMDCSNADDMARARHEGENQSGERSARKEPRVNMDAFSQTLLFIAGFNFFQKSNNLFL